MADPVIDPAQATPEAGKEPVTPPAADPAAATPPVEPKAGEPPAKEPNKPTVPEKYDLKMPENSLLDPSTIEKISTYAKEKGLSNEAAQELLERENQAVASYHEAQMENVKKIQGNWLKECEADKEIGGAEFKKNAELAKRVVDRFASEEFKKALNESGFGNHPELVRTFMRIGREMGEDVLIHAKSQGGQKPMEDVFYGSTKQ